MIDTFPLEGEAWAAPESECSAIPSPRNCAISNRPPSILPLRPRMTRHDDQSTNIAGGCAALMAWPAFAKEAAKERTGGVASL